MYKDVWNLSCSRSVEVRMGLVFRLETDWRAMRDIEWARALVDATRPIASCHKLLPYSSTSLLGCLLIPNKHSLPLVAPRTFNHHHVQFIATPVLLIASASRHWQARCAEYPRCTCFPRAFARNCGEQDAPRCRQQGTSQTTETSYKVSLFFPFNSVLPSRIPAC
jgi:hypothetical protein